MNTKILGDRRKKLSIANETGLIACGRLPLPVDVLCSACANNRCAGHSATVTVTDEETGLEFEAGCRCTNHGELRQIKTQLRGIIQ